MGKLLAFWGASTSFPPVTSKTILTSDMDLSGPNDIANEKFQIMCKKETLLVIVLFLLSITLVSCTLSSVNVDPKE